MARHIADTRDWDGRTNADRWKLFTDKVKPLLFRTLVTSIVVHVYVNSTPIDPTGHGWNNTVAERLVCIR